MGKFIDLSGQKFNRLTVISRAPNKGEKTKWYCNCACGKKTIAGGDAIKNGSTKSCGCYTIDRITTHGNSKHYLYKTWEGMAQRCANESAKDFSRYGGRGITVCDRWLESFDNFISDMGERPCGHSLDRINNDCGYNPENCKWSTKRQQQNNTRHNVFITANGETKTLAQWAISIGVNQSTLNNRYRRGWSHDDIINRRIVN